jgi:hypothetical protein
MYSENCEYRKENRNSTACVRVMADLLDQKTKIRSNTRAKPAPDVIRILNFQAIYTSVRAEQLPLQVFESTALLP